MYLPGYRTKKLRMRTTLLFVASLFILLGGNLPAQARAFCSKPGDLSKFSKVTVADIAEEQYDIKYVKLDINLTNTSIYVSGSTTTTAQVTAVAMPVYVFELDTALTIDSVIYNGQKLTVSSSGAYTRKAVLPAPLAVGSLFTIQVFYHGMPPTGAGFFTGISHMVSSSGVHMVYTVSDPYAAKDWWACKQSITDKIDSADIWITVPVGLKAGSNGLLQAVTSPVAGYLQYKWQTRYPIDYYLLCASVAPYFDYSYYMHFTGSTDSMLIQNYFYDSATFMPAYKNNFDSTGLMVDYFSTLYGRYPFYKEKYGHCFTTLDGGMEHQTMTTIGVTTTPLIAHELGHQWFGDHVTYKSWGHVWLSEGFATYTEQLYVGHFWGSAAAASYRKNQYNNIMSQLGGSVYVKDTTTIATLFDGRLVYYKGAGVVHMLRYLAPTDSLFFEVLKQYQQQYAFGLATTEDLKNIAATLYGQNLDTFFNQWVYEEGYPTYAAKWNQKGDQKYIQVTQTTSRPASVPVFFMPLEIRLKSNSGADTTIRIMNNQATQLYNVSWPNTIDSVFIDPNNAIIKRTGAIKYDATLKIGMVKWNNIQVTPNPAKAFWQASNLPEAATLSLMDMDGRSLWKGKSINNTCQVPAGSLAPGAYILRVEGTNGESATMSVVHW